ncbi:hypothetical protein IAQ61_005694 [Plenodomus lingam]|uniref:uncharacterized protein n=1 Tax=Leptosphaeria maculans TaxID=5022 RepID=UPI003317D2AC|nr:hypothetical protein IAQ61_005694 [Plenodomus lingam]
MSHRSPTASRDAQPLSPAKGKSGDMNSTTSSTATTSTTSIFTVPAPIKHLFDKFPLQTYAANGLPQRAPRQRDVHVLYVFAGEESRSFHPACLKWEAYLRFNKIPFRIARSNNHASPSGSLPFLLPAQTDGKPQSQPVPSAKLQRWAMLNSGMEGGIQEPGDIRYEAYLSLIEHRIRRAWLYTIYLSPPNSPPSTPLYILPTTTNPLVRLSLAHSLRQAATSQLLLHTPTIHPSTLLAQADEAFAALDALLGQDSWI